MSGLLTVRVHLPYALQFFVFSILISISVTLLLNCIYNILIAFSLLSTLVTSSLVHGRKFDNSPTDLLSSYFTQVTPCLSMWPIHLCFHCHISFNRLLSSFTHSLSHSLKSIHHHWLFYLSSLSSPFVSKSTFQRLLSSFYLLLLKYMFMLHTLLRTDHLNYQLVTVVLSGYHIPWLYNHDHCLTSHMYSYTTLWITGGFFHHRFIIYYSSW